MVSDIIKKISLIEEIKTFLDYLQKSENYPKKRTREELEKTFGKEKHTRIENFCKRSNYCEHHTFEEINKEGNTNQWETQRITIEGIRYLEECKKEKREKINNIIQLGATIGLLVCTIIYVVYTGELNKTAKEQLFIENRPYIFVDKVEITKQTLRELTYNIEITNSGERPGKNKGIYINNHNVRCGEIILPKEKINCKYSTDYLDDLFIEIKYSNINEEMGDFITKQHFYSIENEGEFKIEEAPVIEMN